MNDGAQARPDPRTTYFYVSYAHVPPTPNNVSADTNHWVKVFFGDLSAAVQQRADMPARVGFYDALLPPGQGRHELIRARLESVEVFVPLYAPNYFSRTWSTWEWDAFQGRLVSAAAAHPESHVCPVWWTPMPSLDGIPYVDRALALGEGAAGYADDGLQTMIRLRFYHAAYRQVVNQLADEIVRVAENEPLGPSPVPPTVGTTEKIHLGTSFVVAVVAPTTGALPAERRSEPYGVKGLDWRPFGSTDALPIATTASYVVEQLNLDAMAVEFHPRGAPFAHNPGILLIDPWCLADAKRLRELSAAIRRLPPWAGLVAVIDGDDPQLDLAGADLVARLHGIVAPNRPVSVAHDLDAFIQITRELVVQSRRDYLLSARLFPPSGPHDSLPRPSFHDDEPPAPSDGDSDR